MNTKLVTALLFMTVLLSSVSFSLSTANPPYILNIINGTIVTSGGAGTVTSITAGQGLTGGIITSFGTITLDNSFMQRFNFTSQIASLNNYTYAQIASNIGNYSADKAGLYTNISTALTIASDYYPNISGLQTSNITTNLRITAVNNSLSNYATITYVNALNNVSLATIQARIDANGNWTLDKVNYATLAYVNALNNVSQATVQALINANGNYSRDQSAIYSNITALQSNPGVNYYSNVTTAQNSIYTLVLNLSSVGNYSANAAEIYTNITSKGAGNITGAISSGYIPYAFNSSLLENSIISQASGKINFNGVQSIADGTNNAAQLSVYYTNDTDTGWYRPGNNEIQFVVGGSEKMGLISQGLKIGGAGSATVPNVFINGDGNTGLSLQGSDVLSLVTNGASALTVSDTGKVGIGTTSPTSILEVQGSSPNITLQTTLTTQMNGVRWYNSGQFDAEITQQPNTGEMRYNVGRSVGWGGRLTFYTDTTEKMRITSTGNVGIGTTSPAASLHVTNSVGTSLMRLGTSADGGQALDVGFDTTNKYITFNPDASTPSYDITFMQNGGTPMMSLDQSTGSVGIGTTNPAQKIHQDSGTATASYHQFTAGTTTGQTASDGFHVGVSATGEAQLRQYEISNMTFYTSNTERARITNSGYVGIGTTDPVRKLQVHTTDGTSSGLLISTLNSGATDSDGFFVALDTANNAYLLQRENAPMLFYTNSSERMRINASGDVGIGTASPLTLLSVGSGSGAKYITLTDTSSAYHHAFIGKNGNSLQFGGSSLNSAFAAEPRMSLNISNGNLGIGTTTPVQKLDVVGNVNATYYYGDGSRLSNISSSSGGNASWNQSFANTLYAPVSVIPVYDYNQFFIVGDFLGIQAQPFTIGNLGSGSSLNILSETNHPGILQLRSALAPTPSGGRINLNGVSELVFQENTSATFIIRPYNQTANGTQMFLGFLNNSNSVAPLAQQTGAYWNLSQNSTNGFNATPIIQTNSTTRTEGQIVHINSSSWYRFHIRNINSSLTEFTIVDSTTGIIVNSQNVTADMPTRGTGFGILALTKGGSPAANQPVVDIDYISAYSSSTVNR